jgi:hypothetical protein
LVQTKKPIPVKYGRIVQKKKISKKCDIEKARLQESSAFTNKQTNVKIKTSAILGQINFCLFDPNIRTRALIEPRAIIIMLEKINPQSHTISLNE